MKVSTKFKVDTTICWLVIALLLLIHYATLTLVSGHTWRVTWSTPPPSLKILRLSIRSSVMSSDISNRIPLTMRLQPLRMRRITWPMRRGQIFPTYLKSLTRFTIHYTTFMALRLRQMELSVKIVHGPVLKIKQLYAHAQNNVPFNVAVNLLPPSFSATTISR